LYPGHSGIAFRRPNDAGLSNSSLLSVSAHRRPGGFRGRASGALPISRAARRILIGAEGINGTVSGTTEATERYQDTLRADPRTSGISFKVDPASGHAFPKLIVKFRPEIVTLGLGEADVDPNQATGKRLSPAEWLEAMHEENVVVIDGRNRDESDLGRFKGAICPDIENFRDFPAWLREHADELRGARSSRIARVESVARNCPPSS